jgi:hypothetical protein
MGQLANIRSCRDPWNKGKLVGQKAPFKLKEIWAIRVRLQLAAAWRCWPAWTIKAPFEQLRADIFEVFPPGAQRDVMLAWLEQLAADYRSQQQH